MTARMASQTASQMASQTNRRLGGVVHLQRGTTYKSKLLDRPGPVLLGLASIRRNGGFRRDKLRSYGGDTAARLLVHPGELYVSLKDVTQAGDLLGAVACFPPGLGNGRVTQDTVKLIFAENARADKNYIYWLLRTPQYRAYCRARAIGTTNLSLRREDFLAFSVPRPTGFRRQLARLLQTLDDKIELHRVMNQTLEELAQAALAKVFVFDPLKGGGASGWSSVTLGEMCDRFGGDVQTGPFGSQLHASDYVTHGTPSIMPKNIKKDRVSTDGIARVRERDAHRLSRYRVRAGDIVCSRRGDVQRRALITEREHGWLCGTGCLKIRISRAPMSSQILYYYLGLPEIRHWLVRHAHGATMANLNTGILRSLPVHIPPPSVAQKLHAQLASLVHKREANCAQSRTLADLRDTLLPGLISGHLGILAAAEVVARAL